MFFHLLHCILCFQRRREILEIPAVDEAKTIVQKGKFCFREDEMFAIVFFFYGDGDISVDVDVHLNGYR